LPQERILIVDSDRSVLGMAAGALRPLGYVVVVATSVRDATSAVGREGFDLVIASETVPDLDVATLVETSRGVNPNARAVIMT
jgi:DNA-binding NtrC family response regulator